MPRLPLSVLPFGLALALAFAATATAATPDTAPAGAPAFPPSLESYNDGHLKDIGEILAHRVRQNPANLWATLIFLGAIVHTFLTQYFRAVAHDLDEAYARRHPAPPSGPQPVCVPARVLHFLGEVEAVFGIWIIPLVIAMKLTVGDGPVKGYINSGVNFNEAIFVVVVMAISSTRPVLRLAEHILGRIARVGGQSPLAWWWAILAVGPVLVSFITEPAAMTICASLLSRKFYPLNPSPRLAYATLGLLFVAISIGGTLTHFAAPPVLMVAAAWDWDLPFMMANFGWKAVLAIVASTALYHFLFRAELRGLARRASEVPAAGPEASIPAWVTAGHVLFLVAAVLWAHYPAYLIFVFLVFLAFVTVTEEFQRDFTLRPAILVGFFLAGLVVHGGMQQWWIAPLLGGLGELPLMLSATALTAFNDNAAITYLCTLVPGFTDGMKYAAVAGAVTGGGLTVIANAPNPAGQSILNKHFEDGINPVGLLLGAALPTAAAGAFFMLLA